MKAQNAKNGSAIEDDESLKKSEYPKGLADKGKQWLFGKKN